MKYYLTTISVPFTGTAAVSTLGYDSLSTAKAQYHYNFWYSQNINTVESCLQMVFDENGVIALREKETYENPTPPEPETPTVSETSAAAETTAGNTTPAETPAADPVADEEPEESEPEEEGTPEIIE